MALRYGGRKLSFDVLSADYDYDHDHDHDHDSIHENDQPVLYRSISDSYNGFESSVHKSNRRKRKGGSKKKKIVEKTDLFGKNQKNFSSIERIKEVEEEAITEKRVDAVFDDLCNNNNSHNSYDENGYENQNEVCGNGENGMLDIQSYSFQTVICEEVRVLEKSDESSIRTVHHVSSEEKDYEILNGGDKRSPFVEVRRRSRPPSGSLDESVVSNEDSNSNSNSISISNSNVVVKEEMKTEVSSKKPFTSGSNGGFDTKLEKTESLDWKQLMTEDADFSSTERSPVGYFMGKIYSGNSLHGTTTIGNEKERERVYDTMFHLPWRCERIISVGYFVCLDSFLSLLTIMPARILMTIWRFIRTRQFSMPSAAELSDFSCFVVLVCGVTLLQQADISLIYHMIRGQGTIKLYVVYNVLEIFDKLCQNFGGDVLQTLFSSAKGLASSLPENRNFWLWRFISDQALAIVSSIMHSFVLLAQAITLSTCIVSHNNALLALLVSNNFAEIKSNVFKRFSRDNIHSLVYFDSIERFHISAFILFVLAQNILEGEGAWFWSFLSNASVVYSCEMLIDIIKHSFIAKFNEIKPIAYSEFLEDLCKQTLNIQPEDGKQNILTFVPLAPACVVIRVLTPVYAAHLPYGPIPWRLLWIFLLSAMTYVMLASLKVMVGMGLQKFATWYVNRCQRRKLHSD